MNRSYLSEFINIILIGIILFLWFTRGCGDGNSVEIKTDTITSVHYIHDTLWHQLPPRIIHTPVKIVYKEPEMYFDTASVIEKYYASMYYEEKWEDSIMDIRINDTISANEIVYRDVKYFRKTPTTVVTNLITPKETAKVKVFAGFNIGGNENELSSFTPELELIMYDKRAFSVGYNLQNKSVELGVKWKISFR